MCLCVRVLVCPCMFASVCLHLCMRLCVSVQTTVKEGICDLVPYTVTVLRPVEAVPLFWCPGIAAPEPGSLSCEHLTGWQTGLAVGPGSAQEEPPWRPIQGWEGTGYSCKANVLTPLALCRPPVLCATDSGASQIRVICVLTAAQTA